MIKIIEKHEYPVPEYRFTCSKCESIVDITEDEVKCVGTQWDSYYEFKCPVCGKSYATYENKVLLKKEFKKLGK